MIVIAWDGFPQYAARCVGAFVRSTNEPVAVVATRPSVPIKGMEELCGCPVFWIDLVAADPLAEIPVLSISTLFVAGWGFPVFNRLRDKVRANGGRVIGLVDNNFIFSLKEIVKAIRFRLFVGHHYDGFVVPGKSGRRLLRFYGVPDDRIWEGLYSADASLFRPGHPLSQRMKKVVYVGQLVERKNVRRLVRAFEAADIAGWSLELYGAGPLKAELEEWLGRRKLSGQGANIHIHDFLQPEELAGEYQNARAFILPSLEEHWGLVVHEAALSGCVLLLSDRVGAGEDFAGKKNVLTFCPTDAKQMARALVQLSAMSDAELDAAGAESAELGRTRASLEKFTSALRGAMG